MKSFIVFICLVHFSWALTADKTWNNYEVTNLKNWNNEVAVNGLFFSVNMHNPLAFYSHYEDLCQLVIPMNSDANDTNFSWTPIDSEGNGEVTCPEQESGNTWWVDPRNWDSQSTSNATPHLERIPCAYDSVMFRKWSDLYVLLPTNPLYIKRFSWNDQTIYSYMFNKTATREEFVKNFIVTGRRDLWDMIKVTGESCTNQTGCECGTMVHYQETCKIIRSECDTSLPCDNAVMPEGHCCSICGCMILITFNKDSFVYSKLETVVRKFLRDKKGLDYHMSRVSGDNVQIVIINSEAKDNYDDIWSSAHDLEKLLRSSDASLSHLVESIESVMRFCSNVPNSYGSLWSISEVMIPLFALASLGILIVLLFQSKISLSKIQDIFKSSVAFAKFDNQFEKDEEPSPSPNQQEQESSKHTEISNSVEPELHSEGKSENGTSSEIDDDSVLVELS